MLKHTTPQETVGNKEQLLLGLVASLKMLLVSLALIVVIVALFSKSLVSFAVVLLTACNLLLSWCIGFVGSSEEVREFASFLAMPQ